MSTGPVVPGQRWVSDSEPELGLGLVLKAEFARVEIFFPAANEHRQYALKTAPLRRVRFKEGDKIKSHEGDQFLVSAVEEKAGLLVYLTDKRTIAEAELSDSISFSKPEERLLIGQIDELATFDLRVESLHRRTELLSAPDRGFLGGRVDLIPHQMYIASEVAARLVPRVLLADEVGLGKTIEAGLILHRLHLTGRAGRVLIVVPEPLIHQWFIELWRRFNMSFSIFDEERCTAIELNQAEANPFLDSQLVICSLGFLSESPTRAAQVLAAGWDLLIVDEAHHLEWSPEEASPQYALVEAIARQTQGLLLLTATPQQLGPESHFARLRLLDPDRYSDLQLFLDEASHYEQVAKAVDRLLAGQPLSGPDRKLFGENSARIRRHCDELATGNEAARPLLVNELLDSFGIGRVMFRNTRAALSGFPERRAILYPLPDQPEPVAYKTKWLAQHLKALGEEKVLLICRTRQLVEEIHEKLQRECNASCALFHEGLTLMQRDRNAAYFAEEEGARILICSEIGSEGRNFQFAHHLVLFDLPENPELLEQRIGRLDRIGQSALIQIHVPYLLGTESEVLARWYHEGLNAFEKNPHGAVEIARALAKELAALQKKSTPKKLEAFLAKSRELQEKVAKKLERGHDRLLELNSCRPERAAELIAQIRQHDGEAGFEAFFVRLMDHFGVNLEELSARAYLLRPGHLITDAFPALPEEGLSVTFDRTRALSREDLGFMSSDHPLVGSTLELFLGAESGNSAFGIWSDSGEDSILLEVHYVLECVAPSAYHLDRFLPPTPIRIAVDHLANDQTEDPDLATVSLQKGDIFRLLDKGVVKRKFIPAMLEKTQELATEKMTALLEAARQTMTTQLQAEIDRLIDLQEINQHVRPAEVEAAQLHKQQLEEAFTSAHLRLDALRLILRTA